MPSEPKIVSFIVDQASGAPDVRAKPMFGEYGIYCDDRMVAMVCDSQLFVKPTLAGRAFAPDAGEAPPYPGAKACLLIDPEHWDDREWLSELFRVSAAALPLPKSRAKRNPAMRHGV
jgi:TfoX/Sxy family transcriptional regulator of competence genes